MENLNRRQRDCVFGEDACLTRTGNGPANRAMPDNIALAAVFAMPTRGHRRPDPALRAGPRPGRLPDAAGRPPSPESESPRAENSARDGARTAPHTRNPAGTCRFAPGSTAIRSIGRSMGKSWAIATRYDKTDESFAAGIHLVAGVVAAK